MRRSARLTGTFRSASLIKDSWDSHTRAIDATADYWFHHVVRMESAILSTAKQAHV
ncbi:hypothetical protein GCM10016234_31620 [Tianweitania populi]|uniref:Uncharacterized protein n=1 Tax=Tianweitania populi TaxID=1607949 RepID=A0A8J3GLW8_9HYPH|nr:hypothetical protein GCM10016234_31620 [Tianweitania populi]